MILLLWFIVCSFLAVAFITVDLLIAAGFVLLMNWLFNAVSDFGEGRRGVKHKLVVELWSRSGELYSSGGPDASKYVRTRSKNSEATSTGYGLAGEDFQNRGTFIVVRDSVFVVSSGRSSPLARDAHNALWNSQRRSQRRKYSLVGRGNWQFEDSRMCQWLCYLAIF